MLEPSTLVDTVPEVPTTDSIINGTNGANRQARAEKNVSLERNILDNAVENEAVQLKLRITTLEKQLQCTLEQSQKMQVGAENLFVLYKYFLEYV